MHTRLHHAILVRLSMDQAINANIWIRSIVGINQTSKFLNFRSKVIFDFLTLNFSFRKICPAESYCVVTVGRVYPKVNEDPPSISNTTTKEEADKLMSKFEGKAFVKRDCLPIDRIDKNGCKKFPSTEGLDPPFGKFKKSDLQIPHD